MTSLAFPRRQSLAFSDFGSDDGEHGDTNGRGYSTLMDELFGDEDETAATSAPRFDDDEDDEDEEPFVYDGADAPVSRASYREQLRDVLDDDAEDDEIDEREVERSLVHDPDHSPMTIGDEALVSSLLPRFCSMLISRVTRTPPTSLLRIAWTTPRNVLLPAISPRRRPSRRFPPLPPLPPPHLPPHPSSPLHPQCPPPSQTESPLHSRRPHISPRRSCTERSRACAPTHHTPRPPPPPRRAHTPPCAVSRLRPIHRASPRFHPAHPPLRSRAPRRRSETLHKRTGTTRPMRARCSDGRSYAPSGRIFSRDTPRTRRKPCSVHLPSAPPRSWPQMGSSAPARRVGGYSCLTSSRLSSASAAILHQVGAFNHILHPMSG